MADDIKSPEENRTTVPHNASQIRGMENGRRRPGNENRGYPGRRRGDHSGPSSSPGGRRRGGQPSGSSSPRGRSRGGHPPGQYNPPEIKKDEEEPDTGYYNPTGDKRRLFGRGNPNKKPRFTKRAKAIFWVTSIVASAIISVFGFFFMGIFNLPNFMKNIEQAGFQRYQVDLNGRSSKWLQAYVALRFAEVDDPSVDVSDRDNLLFRAQSVDTNNPLKDWYRTLRSSSFEQDLFESSGMRFTSIAYKDGDIIKFRTGVITMKGGHKLKFDPRTLGYNDIDTIDALSTGQVDRLNGALRDFVEVKTFENDREARVFLATTLRDQYPGWWKAAKRYHMRQDIQNVIGARKWTFWEKIPAGGGDSVADKRVQLREKRIAMRNKFLIQALPEDSKSGMFIKCLFGVPECKASSDPQNPEGQSHAPTGTNREQKTDGDPENPQPIDDGSSEETLKAGNQAAGEAGDIAGKMLSKLIGKANTLSLLDSLARFDKAMNDGSLAKFITQARTDQVIGVFTAFSVVVDQSTTGQMSSDQVKDFMLQFQHPTNNEGWTTVIEGKGPVNKKEKEKFCSESHQAQMKKNPEKAEQEYQYLCAKNQVGSAQRGTELQDAWNNGPGFILHPFLAAFHAATGGVFDVFNSVIDTVVGGAVQLALATAGLTDDVNQVAASVAKEAMDYGGAILGLDSSSPSGQMSMAGLQGSAAMGEISMRDQGAAVTTPETKAEADKRVVAYEAEQRQNSSLYERYVSPSNPKSLFASALFAVGTNFQDIGQNAVRIFGAALSSPWRVITQPAHASVPDGYAAARFAAITTYDPPAVCMNTPALKMTPQLATNADDLGYFKPSELNWDLMTNKKDWGEALYEKVDGSEDKADDVYNCALLENTARGRMSARYGYAGENAFKSNNSEVTAEDTTTPISGDAQELAQQILDNKNIDISASNFCRYCTEDITHTANGVPAYGNVTININILKFLADLGNYIPININSITGAGSGHSDGSNHYSGNAVDFECGFDEKKADEIAKKYGLMAGNERCDGGVNHSHFSKDGY